MNLFSLLKVFSRFVILRFSVCQLSLLSSLGCTHGPTQTCSDLQILETDVRLARRRIPMRLYFK